jgi:hypothetical protein
MQIKGVVGLVIPIIWFGFSFYFYFWLLAGGTSEVFGLLHWKS